MARLADTPQLSDQISRPRSTAELKRCAHLLKGCSENTASPVLSSPHVKSSCAKCLTWIWSWRDNQTGNTERQTLHKCSDSSKIHFHRSDSSQSWDYREITTECEVWPLAGSWRQDEVVMGWRRSRGWGREGRKAHRGDKVGSGLSSQGSPSQSEKAHMGATLGWWKLTAGWRPGGTVLQVEENSWYTGPEAGRDLVTARGRLGGGEGERACRAQHSEPWTLLPWRVGLLF